MQAVPISIKGGPRPQPWHGVTPLSKHGKEKCLCTGHSVASIPIKHALEQQWKALLKLDEGFQLPNDGDPHARPIVCISLADNKDRCEWMSAWFHRFGLCRLASFYRPERPDPKRMKIMGIDAPGKYGCWTSHRTVVNMAKTQQLLRVLVFEDDVDFVFNNMHNPMAQMQGIVNDIESLYGSSTHKQWDLVRLGQHSVCGTPVTRAFPSSQWQSGQWMPSLWKSKGYNTHALLWSQHGMNEFLRTTYEDVNLTQGKDKKIDVDAWMVQSGNFNSYNVYPQIAIQNPRFESDIQDNGFSYAKWQRWTHTLQYHHSNALDVGALVLLPIALMIGLIVMLIVVYWCAMRLQFNVYITTIVAFLGAGWSHLVAFAMRPLSRFHAALEPDKTSYPTIA